MGYYCLKRNEPQLCPAGQMRNETGAAKSDDCPLCREGYYCPNDTINLHGIPCRETYECREGASIEIDCTPGYYCNGTTGTPPICWPGYYCPNATDTPIPCEFPEYCPEGSNMTLVCDLGYQAMTHAGIRYNMSLSCRVCPPGTYGNHTNRTTCETCPAGYYCPEGTGHGDSNPCPIGYFCPIGSDSPTPCPVGMIGRKIRADVGECFPCPVNTFNDLEAATQCRPCGSSSHSPGNTSICTCDGQYRSFQKSNGACVCLSGYIYFDEVDTQKSVDNSDMDCQQIVDARCSEYEIRLASSRGCTLPELVDCNQGCPDSTGYIDIELGV